MSKCKKKRKHFKFFQQAMNFLLKPFHKKFMLICNNRVKLQLVTLWLIQATSPTCMLFIILWSTPRYAAQRGVNALCRIARSCDSPLCGIARSRDSALCRIVQSRPYSRISQRNRNQIRILGWYQWPRKTWLVKKTEGQKSSETVPLIQATSPT
jgi:hypothetical protein